MAKITDAGELSIAVSIRRITIISATTASSLPVQPTHATSDMYWAEERLGKSRIANAYAYKGAEKDKRATIVFGTDFPVEDINPIYTFLCCD